MKHCISRECTGCIIGTRSKFSFHINIFQTCVVSFFFSLNRQFFFLCQGICSFSTVFRSCLMIDLGCETDGYNKICLSRCPCLPCAYSFSIILFNLQEVNVYCNFGNFHKRLIFVMFLNSWSEI